MQVAQSATGMAALPRTAQRLRIEATDTLDHAGYSFMHFRWMHVKHWKGAKHRSLDRRSAQRKSARKAKAKRKRNR